MSNAVISRSTHSIALVGGVAATGLLARWAVLGLPPAWGALRRSGLHDDRGLEHLVVLLCGSALAAVAAWLLLSLLVCTVDALGPCIVRVDRHGFLRPRLVVAVVSGVVGTLVLTGPGAGADPGAGPGPGTDPGLGPDERPGQQLDGLDGLDGLTLPDRPSGGVRTHRVVPGESLWSITEEELPAGTAAPEVARAWPRLHRLNRARVGPDPDLIHPGTTLRLPAWESARTRGAAR